MLIVAYLLPWITGSLWLLWLESFSARESGFNLPRILGYGYFLGNFICATALYLGYLAFGQLSFFIVSAVLCFLSCTGFLLIWQRQGYGKLGLRFHWPDVGGSSKKLAILLITLVAVHLFFAVYDAIHRPLLPWDAWTTWTYRAKVWFLNQDLSPFIGSASWLKTADPGIYTLHAHTYPLTLSLIQLWPSLTLTHWNDAVATFPGMIAGIALVLALYGQARSLKWPNLLALAGVYLLISIPLLDAHLSLPGYADLWLGGFAGLGFVALLQWSQSRDRVQLLTGLLFLLLGIFIKREGSLWFLMGLLFILMQSVSWKYLAVLAVTAILAVFSGYSLLELPGLGPLGYADGAFYLPGSGAITIQPQGASLAIITNLFVNDSWHLLFFCLSAMLLLLFNTDKKTRRPLVSFLMLLSMVIAAVFFLSAKGAWLKDSTAFGRLLLHVLPALIFMMLIYWRAVFHPTRASGAESTMKGVLHLPLFSALLLATVIMMGAASSCIYLQAPQLPLTEQSTPIPVEAFGFVKGAGKREQGVLIVSRYSGGQAIISNRQGLKNAGKFRYLRFRLTPDKLIDELPLFFWRSTETGRLYNLALEENTLDHLDLGQQQGWKGDIAEYGFIFNERNDRQWRLRGVEFSPDTHRQTLLHMISDWLEFEVWSQHSVNFIYGGADSRALSLVTLTGIWVLLALLIYSLIMRGTKQPISARAIATMLLSGWILLDARWLFNLYQQAQVTHNSYAGKPLAEQYQAGLDAEQYRFFEHLKNEVLPQTPQFIYILDRKTDYFRAKAPWFLAPHNIFNLDTYPRAEYLKKGGYVLILHPVPGLKYAPDTKALRWSRNGILPVSPVHLDPLGTLYRIRQTDN